jgi:tripartite motif-containing protein 71
MKLPRRLVSLSTFLTALFALTTSTVFAASFLTYGNGAWNAPSVWGAASVFGTVGTAEKQFETPTGITVDSNGNIYISEQDNHRIQKFDTTGTFISAWGWGVSDGANHYEICTSNCQAGILGTGDGQFSGTYDIIATGTVIYVVDLVAGQVQELSTDGTFITKWPTGLNGIVTGGNYDPEGLAVDGSGNIYMQGISTAQIKKFDANGNFIATWGWGVMDGANHLEVCTSNCQFGIEGGGDGELYHPTHVEVHGNRVYVSDYLNYRITVYDTSGNFIAEWGWGVQDGASHYEICTSGCQAGIEGSGDGQFNIAEGIRTDSSGNVFVADAGNDNVQEFSSTGTFIKKWGSRGTSAGQFDHGPLGLALYQRR